MSSQLYLFNASTWLRHWLLCIALKKLMLTSGGSRISQNGGRQPLSLGQKPIIWQDFCWKLHGNERNWAERVRLSGISLDPPILTWFLTLHVNWPLLVSTESQSKSYRVKKSLYDIEMCYTERRQTSKTTLHFFTLGKCRSWFNIGTDIKRPNTSIWTRAMKTAPCLGNELVSG